MNQLKWTSPSKAALVSFAGSAGAILALREILAELPADFPVPILYLQHLGASRQLVEVLQYRTALRVCLAQPGARLLPGVVYVCPKNHSFLISSDGTLCLAPTLSNGAVLHAADRLFVSVAERYAERALVIVLSGAGWDGSEGVEAVQCRQGTVFVQDRASSFLWSMPKAALATGCVDLVLPLRQIAPVLISLVRDRHSLAWTRARVAPPSGNAGVHLTSPLESAVNRFLAVTVAAHGADMGNVQLVDRENNSLAIVAQCGFGLDFLEHFRMVRLQDESACGRAMRARRTVFIPDVEADPGFSAHRDVAKLAGFRAVQSTPLIGPSGAFLGVLSTHFHSSRSPEAAGLRMLEIQARRAAAAIEWLQAA